MKNTIIPIPNILTKVFINFESTDPYSVANAFFDQMKEPKTHDQEDNDDQSTADIEVNQTILLDQDTTGNLSPENKDDSDPGSEGNQSTLNKTSSNPPTRILSCDPILSFMSKRKDPPRYSTPYHPSRKFKNGSSQYHPIQAHFPNILCHEDWNLPWIPNRIQMKFQVKKEKF